MDNTFEQTIGDITNSLVSVYNSADRIKAATGDPSEISVVGGQDQARWLQGYATGAPAAAGAGVGMILVLGLVLWWAFG